MKSPKKYRIVVDTNIIVSSLINTKSDVANLLASILRHHTILTDGNLLGEYLNSLCKPKLAKYFTVDEIVSYLAWVEDAALKIRTKSKITACRDKDDNKILALAVDGKADFIITGDADLLELNPFRKIKILTAKEFAKFLG